MERYNEDDVTVRDGCDGISGSEGGVKITVATVAYRRG